MAGHDLHIYPETHTRKPVQRILAKGGKLFIDTVERSDTVGPQEIRKIQREFREILNLFSEYFANQTIVGRTRQNIRTYDIDKLVHRFC